MTSPRPLWLRRPVRLQRPLQMQEMALHQQHPEAHYERRHLMLNRSGPILPPHMGQARPKPQLGSPSSPGSKSATPSPSSSNQEEETDPHVKLTGEKRPSSEMLKPKPKPQKKKKKKDPNEPTKPVSAYALFFRDTQAAIKGQNPNATFGDVSKIVASMWDGLGEEQKQMLLSPLPTDQCFMVCEIHVFELFSLKTVLFLAIDLSTRLSHGPRRVFEEIVSFLSLRLQSVLFVYPLDVSAAPDDVCER
uniref:HMG box domain-containing protein n=1 Tax=Knipowitschia caucasica TaxID=637954 RepID=A0AAV2M8I0_KNICA